jgi:hypothetical protein
LLQAPEGWSRNDIPGGVSFADKYNRLEISSAKATTAPTVVSLTAKEAKELAATGHAVTVNKITEATLTGKSRACSL